MSQEQAEVMSAEVVEAIHAMPFQCAGKDIKNLCLSHERLRAGCRSLIGIQMAILADVVQHVSASRFGVCVDDECSHDDCLHRDFADSSTSVNDRLSPLGVHVLCFAPEVSRGFEQSLGDFFEHGSLRFVVARWANVIETRDDLVKVSVDIRQCFSRALVVSPSLLQLDDLIAKIADNVESGNNASVFHGESPKLSRTALPQAARMMRPGPCGTGKSEGLGQFGTGRFGVGGRVMATVVDRAFVWHFGGDVDRCPVDIDRQDSQRDLARVVAILAVAVGDVFTHDATVSYVAAINQIVDCVGATVDLIQSRHFRFPLRHHPRLSFCRGRVDCDGCILHYRRSASTT